MSLVRLGHTDIFITRVVLGCMFSSRLRPPELERILHAACDLGISSFDTAPLYGFFESERLVGRALRDRRARVQILSKAGLRWDDLHGQPLFSFPNAQGVQVHVRKDSRPASLRMQVEGSLQRLGIDTLDLLQIHHPDVDTPIAASIETLEALRREGKIRAFGVSNFSAQQLDQAVHAAPNGGVSSLQSSYSLLDRSVEAELLPRCRAQGISMLAFSPLAKGALVHPQSSEHSARDGSRFDSLIARHAIARSVDGELSRVARSHHASAAQVALAWLFAQPGLSAAVAGASSVEQVRELAGAAELQLREHEARALGDTFARLSPLIALGERMQRNPIYSKLSRKLGRVRRLVRGRM